MTGTWLLAALAAALLRPSDLRVEYMTEPVTDEAQPRLSWVNEVRRGSGVSQSAYQIQVATDRRFRHKVWDSGKVCSEASHLIEYQGQPLQPGNTYFWRVRVWDQRGKASRRIRGRWFSGLMEPARWGEARWIGAPWQGDTVTAGHFPAPEFQRTLSVRRGLKSATAWVSGLGWCEFAVNGRVVSAPLAPAFTDYTAREGLDKRYIGLEPHFAGYRVLYNRYDIAPFLHRGENAITAVLGGGFFDVDHGLKKMHPYGTPRLLCRIELTYRDGSTEVCYTDGNWQVRPSATTFNELYLGETFDARRTAEPWQQVTLRKAPDGVLRAMDCPSEAIYGPHPAISVEPLEDGRWRVDFGSMHAGWPVFKGIRGRAGDTLRVDFPAEEKNGILRYVFASDEPVSWQPRFVWYAAREAIVQGVDRLTPDMISFAEVRTAVEENASFSCSEELLNRIDAIWLRSQKDNLRGCTASDCPHREKLPYTGDGQIAMNMVMARFDAAAFYQKWIEDIRLAQDTLSGYVPNGAPWEPYCGGGVAWGAAICVMPWEFYLQYGDTRMLRRNLPAMAAYTRYLQTWDRGDGTILAERRSARDGQVLRWLNLGEWAPSFDLPDDALVHTFYCWLCADRTARSARILNEPETERVFQALADSTAAAFHRRFYDPATATYGDFGSNVFALEMGVPEERRAAVVEALRAELQETYRNHLNTGMLATRYLFEVLARNGLNDLACDLLLQRDFPSFGWWLEQGATTTWEQWDGRDSHDHPMFGGGLTWLHKCLAGVDTDPEEPGFRHILVRPYLAAKVGDVRYQTESPYGKVGAEVHHDSTSVRVKVTVPAGCHATVFVPGETAPHEVAQGTWTFTADKVAE